MPRAADEADPPRGRRPRRARSPSGELRGKLRAHDPFELIRWLALSQPDPRKALAELVQNSLDAGASRIRVTRRRDRREPCLWIFDDGEGVIPELQRPDALRYIATHIGHSRKRDLSPQQRLSLMTQGQYGIGLLGFWSLGQMLEIRTALPGQRPHRLVLHRDRPDYRIEPLRGRLDLDERFTEVVVVGLHREAMNVLVGRRAADYLASELRGQLLGREVDLVVEDRMARGRAEKSIQVRPLRFLGERQEGIGPVPVPGHAPIRLEVYLAGEGGESEGGLAVYSAGTLVAQSFAELSALGLDRAPWTDRRLLGLVDFPEFRVAPGSRRGVYLDEAAGAFAQALATIEPLLLGILERLERQRLAELDKTLVRDLQRAYRDFFRQRPRYQTLPVRSEETAQAAAAGIGAADSSAAGEGDLAAAEGEVAELLSPAARRPAGPIADLLPPGPLVEVGLSPSPVVVECNGSRIVRAIALDAAGRRAAEPLEHEWQLTPSGVGGVQTIDGAADRVRVFGGERAGSGTLSVVVRQHGASARAEATVEVVEQLARGPSAEGIPEPELVHQPASTWRSRMLDGRWQVNSGHRDFRAVLERPAIKLRYLAMLFAKEVVLRSSSDPRLEEPLEQLVEVAAYGDRHIAAKRGSRRPSQPKDE